ncbi:hypothetical protein E3983_03720 [Legionella israelensis]|uniref:Uncharacterized protein n=1 Tax=Legionella israelensis TaxID=454 RepID=A0AAX1EFE7_9GAMM|nr:hypothetical protein [Legionella israelensis]QBR83544.1 hypothetical protein E3983_03720 [Legionella israelensis]
MPRKKPETIQERVLSNIADSLIAFLTDESEKGREKILNAIKLAGRDYKGEEYNWLFTYWRKRKEIATYTERDIDGSLSIIPRLQALAKVFLDPTGGWKSTSYNTTLLFYFLGALENNTNPTADPFFNSIVYDLADPFKRKLQDSLHEHLIAQKIAQEKARELESISDKAKKEALNFVHIFSNHEKAREYAMQKPQQISFALFFEKGKWQLAWYDVLGDDYSLEINKELNKQLSLYDEKDIIYDDAIKFECIKLRDAFIEKRKLFINPSASELSNIKSTFVLKGQKENYELYWYDNEGDCRQIDLAPYPFFLEYLNSQDKMDENNLPQLQAFLRKLNPTVSTGISKARQTLEKFFKNQKIEGVNSFKLLVNPAVHALDNLISTFVIYKNREDIRLEWYDAFGNGREISLEPYDKLISWLKAHEDIAEEDYPELKQQLLCIDTSQRINRDEFKKQLEECLLKGRPQVVKEEKNTSRLKDTLSFDLKDFQAQLEGCFNKKRNELKENAATLEKNNRHKNEEKLPGKLDLSKFDAVTCLFGHKKKPVEKTSLKNEETSALNQK